MEQAKISGTVLCWLKRLLFLTAANSLRAIYCLHAHSKPHLTRNNLFREHSLELSRHPQHHLALTVTNLNASVGGKYKCVSR